MYLEAQSENAELRQQFARNNLLPEWSNPHCYLAKMPVHSLRLVSKTEICKNFKLTDKEYIVLQDLDGPHRNKARLVAGLITKQALKVVDGEWMINPTIRLAHGWWSPYMFGVLLVDWENEHWTTCSVSSITDIDRISLMSGALFAYNVQSGIA